MKYGILGATGPTGLEILKQVAGDEVSVYVRTPSKVPAGIAKEVVEGALTDTDKLGRWAGQQQTVFCALGHNDRSALLLDGLHLKSYHQKTLMQDAVRTVIEGKPKRIIHCSAYGTGETLHDLPGWFGKIVLPMLLKHSFADHEAVEQLLERSGCEWTIALPGMLTNGPRTGRYRAVERFSAGQTVSISRADVADFMIRAAKSDEFLRRRVGLGY